MKEGRKGREERDQSQSRLFTLHGKKHDVSFH